MSSQEVRAKLRTHFLRLSDRRDIPSNDTYWELFWTAPKSASDIFEGISNSDIRSVCHTRNFVKLLRIASVHLVYLSEDETELSATKILNCMRILTRFLPYFYENPIFAKAEHQIFWSANSTIIQPLNKKSPQSTTATVNTVDSASTYTNQDYDEASIEANLEFNNHSDVKSDKVEISMSDANAPLGAQLVNTAVNLLFTRGFTVECNTAKPLNGIEFAIWEPGIGLVAPLPTVKPEIDSNRLEVLRFLTTLCSQCIYNTPSTVVAKGSRYLTVLVAAVPKFHILTLLSSLLNLTCRCSKSASENGLEFNNATLNHARALMVSTAIQLLTLMIVYPLPKDDILFLEKSGLSIGKPYNTVRYYFGKLHKEQEINFIVTSLIKILKKPLSEVSENEQSVSLSSMIKSKTANVLPSLWGVEVVMLLWELYQCNKRIKLQMINNMGNELAVILTYSITTYRKNEIFQNYVRVCSYFFLFLTSDQVLLSKLLEVYNKEAYEKLPESFKVTPHPVTYRDFLVTKICQILTADEITIISPTLIECLFNLIPIAGQAEPAAQIQNRRNSQISLDSNAGYKGPGGGLSYSTCNAIAQLIIKYSAHRFLTAQDTNPDYLALLMRAICQAICRFPKQSRNLIFTVTKNAKYLENISVTIENMEVRESDEEEEPAESARGTDTENGSATKEGEDDVPKPQYTPYNKNTDRDSSDDDDEEEIEVSDHLLRPKPPTGMSAKAKGKAPRHASLKRSWAGYTSFSIILGIVAEIRERLDEFENLGKADTVLLLSKIENLELTDFIESIARTEYLQTKSNLEQLKFVWTNLSLGWYESILWGSIFSCNETTSRRYSKTISLNSTISTFSKVSSDWGFGRWSNSEADSIEAVNRSLVTTNIWFGTKIKLFKTDKFLITQKGNLSDQLMRRFSDFKITSPQSPTLPPQPSRQNSVISISSAPTTPTLQKDEMFGEMAASIKVTPRNSMHRLSVSSNFNSPRNLTRNNSTVTTPITGSPRISSTANTPVAGSPRNSISLDPSTVA